MAVYGKRRALGQHFLRDRTIIDTIATSAVEGVIEKQCRALLEIGPGRGAITRPILELLDARAHELPPKMPMILSERDRDLAENWKAHAAEKSRLRVESGDFLELPKERWLTQTPLAVVSNLPYSAGTAIVVKLARHPEQIPVMVLMFQAEVAHRLRAEPGTKS